MKPFDKRLTKEKAILLRRDGKTFEQISKEIYVSKSTVYSWTKDLKLSTSEMALVELRRRETYKKASKRLIEAKKRKSAQVDQQIYEESISVLNNYIQSPQSEKIILSMLFWGEGEKDTSSGLRFINSDPSMVSVYLRLLRSNFIVDESKFRVMLHVHDYHDTNKQIKYWSKITNINTTQFYKPYLKKNTGKQKKKNYQGTVSIRYSDYKLGKLLKMIYTNYGQL